MPDSQHPSVTRRVAVWHTNAVVTDVPEEYDLEEAEAYILDLVDQGVLNFVSVEGGTQGTSGTGVAWMERHAYQPLPEADANAPSSEVPDA
jgi:hypothetical protein